MGKKNTPLEGKIVDFSWGPYPVLLRKGNKRTEPGLTRGTSGPKKSKETQTGPSPAKTLSPVGKSESKKEVREGRRTKKDEG